MAELIEFKVFERIPSRRPAKTVEIDSYWEAIRPNPNLLEEPIEEPRKYKKECPPDRALVVVHEGRVDVLDHIGPGLDYLSDECMLNEEVESFCDGLSGVFILEGRMVTTGPDYNGEYEAYFDGDFRPATKEEWAAHLDGEFIWNDFLWYESETVADAK